MSILVTYKFLSSGRQVPLVQEAEQCMRPSNDRRGHARQRGDLQAVGGVRHAGREAMRKHKRPTRLLLHLRAVATHPGQRYQRS